MAMLLLALAVTVQVLGGAEADATTVAAQQ